MTRRERDERRAARQPRDLNFPGYVFQATGRNVAELDAFELAGLALACACHVEPVDALDFLGRFGTLQDLAAAATEIAR